MRAAWGTDPRTALVIVDPTSPNIMQFRSGAAVAAKLARPFFVELQSRYGNLYYVREEVGLCQVQLLLHLCRSFKLFLWLSRAG